MSTSDQPGRRQDRVLRVLRFALTALDGTQSLSLITAHPVSLRPFFKAGPLPPDYFISHFIELLPHFMLDKDLSHCRRNPDFRDGLSTMDYASLPAVLNQISSTFQFAHVATDQVRQYFMVRKQSYFPC